MTREDIIRMAQEAGGRIEHIGTNIAWFEFLPKNLERFAALVAAAKREACANVCDGWLHADGNQCAAAIREMDKK